MQAAGGGGAGAGVVETFHFRIVKVLKDDCDRKGEHKFIFGAIYEHAPAGTRRLRSTSSPCEGPC